MTVAKHQFQQIGEAASSVVDRARQAKAARDLAPIAEALASVLINDAVDLNDAAAVARTVARHHPDDRRGELSTVIELATQQARRRQESRP